VNINERGVKLPGTDTYSTFDDKIHERVSSAEKGGVTERRWTSRTRAVERGKWVRREEERDEWGFEGGEVGVETVTVYMFFGK
jgi:hypothetical protein